MPHFDFVTHPVFSPTRCAGCMTHRCEEGFVDLICLTATAGFRDGAPVEPAANEPTYGRLYLCARCVFTAARMVGCLDPEQASALRVALAERDAQLDDALATLETERETRVTMPAAELQRMQARWQQAGEKATAARKAKAAAS